MFDAARHRRIPRNGAAVAPAERVGHDPQTVGEATGEVVVGHAEAVEVVLQPAGGQSDADPAGEPGGEPRELLDDERRRP